MKQHGIDALLRVRRSAEALLTLCLTANVWGIQVSTFTDLWHTLRCFNGDLKTFAFQGSRHATFMALG